MGKVVGLEAYRHRFRPSQEWRITERSGWVYATLVPCRDVGLHGLGVEYMDERRRLHMKPLELQDLVPLRRLAAMKRLKAGNSEICKEMMLIGLGTEG